MSKDKRKALRYAWNDYVNGMRRRNTWSWPMDAAVAYHQHLSRLLNDPKMRIYTP